MLRRTSRDRDPTRRGRRDGRVRWWWCRRVVVSAVVVSWWWVVWWWWWCGGAGAAVPVVSHLEDPGDVTATDGPGSIPTPWRIVSGPGNGSRRPVSIRLTERMCRSPNRGDSSHIDHRVTRRHLRRFVTVAAWAGGSVRRFVMVGVAGWWVGETIRELVENGTGARPAAGHGVRGAGGHGQASAARTVLPAATGGH